ncbi:uncharacterized protein METZ01_LOCUS387249, partial [marine metagenome]
MDEEIIMKKYLPFLFISLILYWSCEDEAEPKDCAGVEGGTAVVDSCGVCDSDSTNDCIQDCSGEWGGTMFDCGGGCDENIELWGECYNIETTTHLEFHDDRQGEIPAELGQLVNLTRLIIHNNQLSGAIPPELGNLVNLTHLELDNNNLTGQIPIELSNMPNYEYLSVSQNQLTGGLTEQFIQNLLDYGTIERLWLEDNNLSGIIPELVCDLKELGTLVALNGNDFCPPYPECLEEWDINNQNCIFQTKEELQFAVDLWMSDNTTALETYGDINT